jgi:hypothetical protein
MGPELFSPLPDGQTKTKLADVSFLDIDDVANFSSFHICDASDFERTSKTSMLVSLGITGVAPTFPLPKPNEIDGSLLEQKKNIK